MMIRRILCVVILASAAAPSRAQTFEVASVRRSAGHGPYIGCKGGPESSDPGQFTCYQARLKDIAVWAYDVEYYFQVEGPKWIDSDANQYDLRAKLPEGATEAQMEIMLQNLLAERFHMAIHRENRVMPVFDLVIAKGGPKFKESSGEFPAKPGFPVVEPGKLSWNRVEPTGRRLSAHEVEISQLLRVFGSGRPVIDKTGLTGKYDAWLEYDARPLGGAPDDAAKGLPSLSTALEEQLGLKLVDTKKTYEIVVIDRADKEPVEN